MFGVKPKAHVIVRVSQVWNRRAAGGRVSKDTVEWSNLRRAAWRRDAMLPLPAQGLSMPRTSRHRPWPGAGLEEGIEVSRHRPRSAAAPTTTSWPSILLASPRHRKDHLRAGEGWGSRGKLPQLQGPDGRDLAAPDLIRVVDSLDPPALCSPLPQQPIPMHAAPRAAGHHHCHHHHHHHGDAGRERAREHVSGPRPNFRASTRGPPNRRRGATTCMAATWSGRACRRCLH